MKATTKTAARELRRTRMSSYSVSGKQHPTTAARTRKPARISKSCSHRTPPVGSSLEQPRCNGRNESNDETRRARTLEDADEFIFSIRKRTSHNGCKDKKTSKNQQVVPPSNPPGRETESIPNRVLPKSCRY